MLIDKINLNLLRIFEKVYETKSMTRASQELFMTQSGVSQNIKHLEEILELKLFDRVKQRLLPTEKASILYENCKKNLRGIEQTLLRVTEKEEELMGSVSIGLPIEFGNNLVLPLLHKLGEKYPKVTYRIKYGLGQSINKELFSGGLHFAFVDDFNLYKIIKLKKITDETLVMCASESYMAKFGPIKNKKSYFENLDYLDY
ncbi:MAG: LysR family transcriptional regulator, partial [Bdellovibrionota bacterium]|nr:LysR family transcriptional regulator [Bdellovibrionota bacterium]